VIDKKESGGDEAFETLERYSCISVHETEFQSVLNQRMDVLTPGLKMVSTWLQACKAAPQDDA
jgi:hypothetical protein